MGQYGSNYVDSYDKGLAQTMQALMMAISPALVTSLFAFSIQSQIFGGNLVYLVLLLIGVIGVVQAFSLKEKGEFVLDEDL